MKTVSRKRKTKDPCPICYLHKALCICEFIPSLNLKTKIWLMIHAKELKRTTNTGRLALQSLPNSEMKTRGLKDEKLDLSLITEGQYHPLLLFPAADAIELSKEFVTTLEKPILLIVPDGNWRQASKVHHRHPEFENVQRVVISAENTEKNFLRKESTKNGMATLQAIAYALGIIEGESIQAELLKIYQLKLSQTLIGRGHISSL